MPAVSLPLHSLFTGEHHAQDAAGASVRQHIDVVVARLVKLAKERSMQEGQGKGSDSWSDAELVDRCCQCGQPIR